MKKLNLLLLLFLLSYTTKAQQDYPTPPEGLIPEKLTQMERLITVNHFPKINDPIKIKDKYYWKHATTIFSKEQEVVIVEYGAYLYYNDRWNLRQEYALKDLDKSFKTKNQKLLQAQPYTWNDNWRVDNRLFGGWALWYFIGKTTDGKTICGYQKINTTSNLINSKN